MTEVHFAAAKADPAAAGDHDRLIVKRIREFLEPAINARGARVELCGDLHPQRLMGPVRVVARDEVVEAALLLQHVRGGGLRGFALQREVHALVPSVLLWVPGPDPLDLNPETEPPDRQLAQTVERVR